MAYIWTKAGPWSLAYAVSSARRRMPIAAASRASMSWPTGKVCASVPRKSAGSSPCRGRSSGVGCGVGDALAATELDASGVTVCAVGEAAPGVGGLLQAASAATITARAHILDGRIGSPIHTHSGTNRLSR